MQLIKLASLNLNIQWLWYSQIFVLPLTYSNYNANTSYSLLYANCWFVKKILNMRTHNLLVHIDCWLKVLNDLLCFLWRFARMIQHRFFYLLHLKTFYFKWTYYIRMSNSRYDLSYFHSGISSYRVSVGRLEDLQIFKFVFRVSPW